MPEELTDEKCAAICMEALRCVEPVYKDIVAALHSLRNPNQIATTDERIARAVRHLEQAWEGLRELDVLTDFSTEEEIAEMFGFGNKNEGE